VPIAGAKPSAVLADQVKRDDWVARKVQYKGQLTTAELEQIQRVVAALIVRP
jgi:mRNA interferase MazF